MSSNQTNVKNISSMTNNNKKRSFFNLQSTKELIKYSDSILESHEGEFVTVQNLLTAKKRYTNDAHMDNDDTIILTTYGKSNDRDDRRSRISSLSFTSRGSSNSTGSNKKYHNNKGINTVAGTSICEGEIEVKAKGKRSTRMFGRSTNKLSSKFDKDYVRIFSEYMQPGALSSLVVRFIIYKDKKAAKQAVSYNNNGGNILKKEPTPPLASIRLKSTHSVAFQHDANKQVDYITISNIYEVEDDDGDPLIILRFRNRDDSKLWLDKLNLALTGIHASRVIADTNWISSQSSWNHLMKEQNLNLDDIITHARHGNEYQNVLRMVKAHETFLNKQDTGIKKNAPPSSS